MQQYSCGEISGQGQCYFYVGIFYISHYNLSKSTHTHPEFVPELSVERVVVFPGCLQLLYLGNARKCGRHFGLVVNTMFQHVHGICSQLLLRRLVYNQP